MSSPHKSTSKALDAQFISEYARREGISVQESERRIVMMIDTMRDILLLTTHLSLRRFGTFYLGKRKNAKYKNNHTGMMETIPIIKTIRFKPSKSIKQELNEKTKDNLIDKFRL
jgi:nucleoid DNA-binding protein